MARPIQLKSHNVWTEALCEMVFRKMSSFGKGRLVGDNNESSTLISRDGDTEFAHNGEFIWNRILVIRVAERPAMHQADVRARHQEAHGADKGVLRDAVSVQSCLPQIPRKTASGLDH